MLFDININARSVRNKIRTLSCGAIVTAALLSLPQSALSSTEDPMTDILGTQGFGSDVIEVRSDSLFICDTQRQRRRNAIFSVLSFVPLVGEVSDVVDATFAVTEAFECTNSNGDTVFTWEDIMDEVDNKIGLAISQENRDSINDQLQLISEDFANDKNFFQTFLESDNLGQFDINTFQDRLTIYRAALDGIRGVFNALGDDALPTVSVLGEVMALEHSLDSLEAVMLSKVEEGDELSEDFHFNVTRELNRKALVRSFLKAENVFGDFHTNLNLFRQLALVVAGGGNAPISSFFDFSGTVTDREGTEFEDNIDCARKCVSRVKNGAAKRLEDKYRNEIRTLNEAADEEYFDVFNQLNVLRGKRFYLTTSLLIDGLSDERMEFCLGRSPFSSRIVTAANCSFLDANDNGEHVVNSVDSREDIWRLHDNSGLVVHEKSGKCLSVAPEGVRLINCEFPDARGETDNNTLNQQQWGLHPAGLLISLPADSDQDAEQGFQCLTPNFPYLPALTKECAMEETKDEEVPRSSTGTFDSRSGQTLFERIIKSNQIIKVKFVECDADDQCIATDEFLQNNGVTPEENQVRHPLTADLANAFDGSARFTSDTSGFTDAGFIELTEQEDRVTWANRDIVRGNYSVKLHVRALNDVADDAEPPVIEIQSIGKSTYSLATKTLDQLISTKTRTVDVVVDIPKFSHSLTIKLSNESGLLIDKVILTPTE